MNCTLSLTREEELHIVKWYYGLDSSSNHREEEYRKSDSGDVLVSDMERALGASECCESGFTVSPPSENRRS